jgi:hypothetical protein
MRSNLSSAVVQYIYKISGDQYTTNYIPDLFKNKADWNIFDISCRAIVLRITNNPNQDIFFDTTAAFYNY